MTLRGSPSLLEIGTLAEPEDEDLALGLVGGEGDCVEVTRADYLALLDRIRTSAATPAEP